DLRKISASQNNPKDKSSVDSVSGLASAGQPQILPNYRIKKLDVKDFSKTLLGEYMGEMKGGDWSYSIGTLKEKDGYLLLILTDYTEEEEGFRGHMTHVYAGVPDWEGISFTHYLYPYDDDRSLVEQIREETPLDSPYTFVITEDNKLRSVDRVLELQESYGIKDTPVSERNMFHLAGKVQNFLYIRLYMQDFLEMVKDDEYGDPFENTGYEVKFSKGGDLVAATQFDASAEAIAKYDFKYSNNGEVIVDGKVGENIFNAKYKRRISPFKIEYDGIQKLYDNKGETLGGGSLRNSIELNLNGYPVQIYKANHLPPFVMDADGDIRYIYYSDSNSLVPTSGQMTYWYGPDAFQFDNVEFKDIKTDNVGNWILRKVYIDGNCAYIESRDIVYY
ncbi:MAG: hypothetical protein K2H60_09725, partial [Muribaculaceae bacterium]|nr:hypothetical protein [Muribaculaceae bacterium]